MQAQKAYNRNNTFNMSCYLTFTEQVNGVHMGNFRIDWRWIAVIAVIAVLASSARLPWPVTALVLGGSGGYLLLMGWRAWARAGGAPSRSKVTYWRGQRIEVGPQRRGPSLPRFSDIGPALLPLLLGGVLVLAAASIVLSAVGL